MGERLKAVRRDILGISSGYTLAKEMGISQSSYASYELGKMEIGTVFLAKLYEKYGVLPTYITTGHGPVLVAPGKKKEAEGDLTHLNAMVKALAAKVDRLSKLLPEE